jgi:hypothetical protein
MNKGSRIDDRSDAVDRIDSEFHGGHVLAGGPMLQQRE